MDHWLWWYWIIYIAVLAAIIVGVPLLMVEISFKLQMRAKRREFAAWLDAHERAEGRVWDKERGEYVEQLLADRTQR